MQFHYYQVLRFSLLALHGIYLTVSTPSKVIICESRSYKYKSCPVPEVQGGVRVSSVSIFKQLSKTACTAGKSYGCSVTEVWVTKGCRANFLVEYEEAASSSSVQVPTTSTESVPTMDLSSSVAIASSSIANTVSSTMDLFSGITSVQVPTASTESVPTMEFSSSVASSSIANTVSSTMDLFSGITSVQVPTASTESVPTMDLSSSVASSIVNIDSSTLSSSIHPTSVQDAPTSTIAQTQCRSQLSVSTRFCYCKNNSHVISLTEIIRALRLDTKKTSKSVRKMTSANDSRIISVGIGVSSIVFLLVSALLVIASDMVTFYTMITRQKVHTMLKTGNRKA